MKGYTIRKLYGDDHLYEVRNPSGVPIAFGMSWRVARNVADALDGLVFQRLILARLEAEIELRKLRES
jgi:hypothetical protein